MLTIGQIKVIATDLDGTLLNDQGRISDYYADVLSRCRGLGIALILATARPVRAAKLYRADIEADYAVANLGASIARAGELVYERFIPRDTKDALIEDLAACPDIACISVEAGGRLYTDYSGGPIPDDWNAVRVDFRAGLRRDTPKITVQCDSSRALEAVLARYPRLKVTSNSGESWYQIVCEGVSKSAGLAYVLRDLGLDFGDAVAFGDDYGDIDLLERCAIGVAVSNANEQVRRAADFICAGNDQDGVASWLEQNVISR